MKRLIIPVMIFLMTSCSTLYETTTTTVNYIGDIVWMNDDGEEVRRYENSVIDYTKTMENSYSDGMSSRNVTKNPDSNLCKSEFIRFSSGGKTRMISGGMILIDNIRTEVVTDRHRYSETSLYNEISKFVCKSAGIRYRDLAYNDTLADMYMISGKKLDIVEFTAEFEKMFDITATRYAPRRTSTIHDLYEIVNWCKMFPETSHYKK